MPFASLISPMGRLTGEINNYGYSTEPNSAVPSPWRPSNFFISLAPSDGNFLRFRHHHHRQANTIRATMDSSRRSSCIDPATLSLPSLSLSSFHLNTEQQHEPVFHLLHPPSNPNSLIIQTLSFHPISLYRSSAFSRGLIFRSSSFIPSSFLPSFTCLSVLSFSSFSSPSLIHSSFLSSFPPPFQLPSPVAQL